VDSTSPGEVIAGDVVRFDWVIADGAVVAVSSDH
jgi:hypothetical protein